MLEARAVRVPVVARAKTFFAWGSEPISYDLERADLYATGWAVTHFLSNREPARFSQLLARLARAEQPEVAWKAVFPEWDPASDDAAKKFEAAVENYVEGSQYTYMRFELTPDVAISSERELHDAEVHVVLGTLLARAPRDDPEGNRPRAAAQLAESLRVSPGNAAALWAQGALAPAPAEDREARARQAVATSPGDWRAWLLLGDALGRDGTGVDDPGAAGGASAAGSADGAMGGGDGEGADARRAERLAAYDKAAQLAPDNGGVLNAQAWTLLEHGDSVAALPIAVRAVRAAPWDAAVVDTLGAVLADLGRGCEAAAVQQRAVELLPEGAGGDEIRKRLGDFQAQCRATKQ
jgi:hypothetical protein